MAAPAALGGAAGPGTGAAHRPGSHQGVRAVQEALLAITSARCGTIALYDEDSKALTGVFSDGDFRRASLRTPDILSKPVSEFMTPNPKTIQSGALAIDALKVFEKYSFNDLLVVDTENHPIGVIDGQDMPKLRIV